MYDLLSVSTRVSRRPLHSERQSHEKVGAWTTSFSDWTGSTLAVPQSGEWDRPKVILAPLTMLRIPRNALMLGAHLRITSD